MQLAKLIDGLEVRKAAGDPAVEITSIAYNSRDVQPGCLFVAIRGTKSDGHQYLAAAVEKGAAAVLCEEFYTTSQATSLEVANTRRALSRVASTFYGAPSRKLKVGGITGTNGKTTTAFLLKHLCDRSLLRCGLIGTVRYEFGEEILPASHTTPESLDLEALLAKMRNAGCKAVVMEVSSHALAQERVTEIDFDVVVFTNLTQDHLDYHRTMNEYFEVKARLFTGPLSGSRKRPRAIINTDDTAGQRLAERAAKVMPVTTYGMNARADFRGINFKQGLGGTTFQLEALGRSYLVRTPLIGRFNVYNTLAALAASMGLGLDLRACVQALADAPQVPGRLQLLPGQRNYRVFVDYAHTPDALLNALRTLRELLPSRLIVLFGCGGDRDRAKRALMAQVAEEYADYSIVTSDNPRSEAPAAIIADILRGFTRGNHEVIEERREAIFQAIELAGPSDIVLIAGKGHETYQETAGVRLPFDDCEIAIKAMEGRRPSQP